MEKWLYKGKILILYGARQVGKTTLVKSLLETLDEKGLYLNCEIQSVKEALTIREPAVIKRYIGEKKLLVLDEAQHIPGIGEILKLLIDTYPQLQIIATGSSSFELARQSSEALTGRALTFELLPLSYSELSDRYNPIEKRGLLPFWLRFGLYPDVAFASEEDARILLDNLSSRYLYKDILEFENIRHPEMLVQLLQLISLQVGQLVSYHELANSLKTSSQTVARYIDLLEKTFVIFRLYPFSRNLRSEIGKKTKIYFYDLGIRNSIIQQFQPPEIRADKGALWENFVIVERLKYLKATGQRPNRYFWRTHQNQEIDYLEEQDGLIRAFEIKWQDKPTKAPRVFTEAYPQSQFQIINTKNFESFVEVPE